MGEKENKACRSTTMTMMVVSERRTKRVSSMKLVAYAKVASVESQAATLAWLGGLMIESRSTVTQRFTLSEFLNEQVHWDFEVLSFVFW